MDRNVVEDWLVSLPELLIEGYDLDDISNCDETGLYYRGLLNRSLCTVEDDRKNVKLLGYRILKEIQETWNQLKTLIIIKKKL
jgi:hypothetical protein